MHGPVHAGGEASSSLVSVLVRRVLPLVMVWSVFAALAWHAAQPLSNPDTFFHLRFGEEFLSGAWSLTDPGSVTALGTADWVPTQWLSQVLMAWIENRLGLPGVAWFGGFQLVLLALVAYVVGRRWADPAVVGPVVVFCVLASTSGLSVRPQVLSYVLVLVTTGVWLAVRDSGRPPWVLVPMTWFWATYHGMWPLGIVIGLVVCVGLAADGGVRARRVLLMLAVPLSCAVAAALTPVGPRLYAAVLLVGSRREYFTEWGPPDFTTPGCLALLLVLGVTALVMLRHDRTTWTEALLLALAAAFAVYSQRTVPVAAAVLVPVAATTLQRLLGPRSVPSRIERRTVRAGAVAALLALALVAPTTAARSAPQPSWAADTLSALPRGTRILGDVSYGGVLMWAYPQLDVVMSGYGDLYTDAEIERIRDVEDLAPGWDDLVRGTGARYALTSDDSRLGYALRGAGWVELRTSPEVDLLEAPAGW